MELSAVIPCRNSSKTIGRCLESLRKMNRTDVTIVVADDGSTDDTAKIAESFGARVLYLEKRGRAAALNSGLTEAGGEAVLFTDSDCVVNPEWADEMEALLEKGYDGVGGNLIPSQWTTVEIAKVMRYLHEFENDYELTGSYTRFCLNGNNMAIRRKALDAIGGFDPDYVHGADADLTRRLLDKGCKLLRTKSVEVTHLKVDSFKSLLDTFYHRGSAVRFAMIDDRDIGSLLWRARLTAIKNLVKDAMKIPALVRRFPEADLFTALPAPLAHFLADMRAAKGQKDYWRRFQSGATGRIEP